MSDRHVTRRIRGTDTSDGAGVKLKRIIGQAGLDMLDPFLLLDEFRSDTAGDYIAGFPEHPHRGFETVTYMLAGHMQHQDIGPERIPVIHPAEGVEVRVIAGEIGGVTGPVEGIATAPVYLDVSLQPGARFALHLPPGHHGFAYVFDGDLAQVGGEPLRRSELGVLSDGDQLQLAGGDKASRLLVVAGKPLQEPVARYGPFVMNTQQEIHEAIADFRAGKF
jgi:redox-sensitive bicupin YhaK (pirin superfamily)